MKNINTIINGVLAIAVIALFVMYSNLKNTNSSVENTTAKVDSVPVVTDAKSQEVDSILTKRILNFPIAFVNLDSVSENFEYFKQKGEQMNKTINYKSKSLQNQEIALAEDAAAFQQSYYEGTHNFTTQAELEAAQMKLQERQESLYNSKVEFEKSITQQQANLLIETNNSLRDFLKKYKEELNYSYVLPAGSAANLLYANDSLDITKEVIEALNEEYKSKLKK